MPIPEALLLQAAKPGRYTGGEVNAVEKDLSGVSTRFALCFPDVYEVGMSHLGLQILYFFLNRRDDVFCERAFMPWPDMAGIMKSQQIPLFSLETGASLSAFDFIGFTLQYEMSYTNILHMLSLAGLPLRASQRGEDAPLICAGGPCAVNPEPLADFFDFFYIGDGEASLDLLMDRYRAHRAKGGSRRAFLSEITDIPGVYVPSFYDAHYREDGVLIAFAPNRAEAPPTVKRALVLSLEDTYFPDRMIVPNIETIHDRASLEIFRGCIRGCRFCQAGYIGRPVRERSPRTLLAQAKQLIDSTGHEEISLVSLAACDHTGFEPLVDGLLERFAGQRVNISLPSLRVDGVSLAAMQKTQAVRKSSLTFAPEAGSQRMRDVINKNLTEQEILDGCARAFAAGFDKVKLYFMTGLPTEAAEDLMAIAALSEQIVDRYYQLPLEKRRRPVSVSVSAACFVPKPFTPFQWSGQDSAEMFIDKQQMIKKAIRKKQIAYRYHDAGTAIVEGALARGGRPLGRVLENVFQRGAIFDGWTEHFDYALWREAFTAEGIDLDHITRRERPDDELLPWDFINMGITKAFLLSERDLSRRAQTTAHCRDACGDCGISALTGGNCHE